MLDGEVEVLIRKAVALGLEGDVKALRLCLERIIAPRRERPLHLDLPPIQRRGRCRGGDGHNNVSGRRGPHRTRRGG